MQVLPTQSGSPHSSTTSASDYSASQQAPPSTPAGQSNTCSAWLICYLDFFFLIFFFEVNKFSNTRKIGNA